MRIGARRVELRHGFKNYVDEFEIDHLVVRDGTRRRGVGHGVRFVEKAHAITHAVIELQLRTQAADERIKDAGLDHRGAQVDRPLGLRIAVAKIECRDAARDVDGDRKLHRPLEGHAIIVEQAFGRSRAFRQPRDLGAQRLARAAKDRSEGFHHRLRAEPPTSALWAIEPANPTISPPANTGATKAMSETWGNPPSYGWLETKTSPSFSVPSAP